MKQTSEKEIDSLTLHMVTMLLNQFSRTAKFTLLAIKTELEHFSMTMQTSQ
jgi:hypothetical protein